jgi:hypothetical protein
MFDLSPKREVLLPQKRSSSFNQSLKEMVGDKGLLDLVPEQKGRYIGVLLW